MATGPTTEVSTNLVDLTPFPLRDLQSGKPAAHVKAAVTWAVAYAVGPDAAAIQSQNE